MTPAGWSVDRLEATAGGLHGREVDWAGRSLTVCSVTAPAVVLGSTQDRARLVADPGMEVVRRRSGGGAVLVAPGGLAWLDVVVPAGDPLWEPDVGRASWWLGRAFAEALGDLGVTDARVHHGPVVRTAWSAALCFAGLGPGEVTVGGRKVVGLAQRRTRLGALFHCAVPLVLDPAAVAGLLAAGPAERAAAASHLAGGVLALTGRAASEVAGALVARLPSGR